MKFTPILVTLLANTAAFAPSTSSTRTRSILQQTTESTSTLETPTEAISTIETPTEENNNVKESRPVYDPLRLYSDTSEERANGRLQAMEDDKIETQGLVLDPLNIYSSEEANNIDTDVDMSDSIPFLPRPALLDRTMAGDVGFDPFNFAGDDAEKLYTMREAEVKHGRIAMLAAIGWPLSELLSGPIAHIFRLPDVLGKGDTVPSLLNGGLETISPVYWATVLAAAGGLEAWCMSKDAAPLAGDYGFDPFGFYPEDVAGQEKMQLAEIKHGRLAMMAVTGFAYQELFTNVGVIHAIPAFN